MTEENIYQYSSKNAKIRSSQQKIKIIVKFSFTQKCRVILSYQLQIFNILDQNISKNFLFKKLNKSQKLYRNLKID